MFRLVPWLADVFHVGCVLSHSRRWRLVVEKSRREDQAFVWDDGMLVEGARTHDPNWLASLLQDMFGRFIPISSTWFLI